MICTQVALRFGGECRAAYVSDNASVEHRDARCVAADDVCAFSLVRLLCGFRVTPARRAAAAALAALRGADASWDEDRDDGSVLWDANAWFGAAAHVDGQVVDDIDPASPGAEVLLFSETGPEWGLYRAADGFPLVERAGPEFHLQWNLAVNVSGGPGLDVVGTFGGHFVTGGFGYDVARRKKKAYPFGAWPREAHNWYPIDWDLGHETAFFGYHTPARRRRAGVW